jgi:GSH-dependent disulfide-bond oxidoreductase
VLDKQLSQHRYIAGDSYTIADIATFPWTRSTQNQGIDWARYPHAKRWHDEIAARPAVQRGVQVLADLRRPLIDDKAKAVLFGAEQYKAR